ncbi:unannotated protein [freshwater metagenome]|uniref:Unannotated protein n=1 Tax=freshwater metagenome TaxID=449393 RepID=A0A6J7CTF8_9ZZZZ|nr:amidohydrolase family protein [Actinomycetota bacterium]
MTETLQTTGTAVAEPPTTQMLIDVDCHPLPTPEDLKAHMPTRWVEYLETYGYRTPSPELGIVRARFMGCRTDAWPPSGKPPGADVDFFREQHLDAFGVDACVLHDIMASIQSFNGGAAPQEFTRALFRAVNAWHDEAWLATDDRFYSSILLPLEDPKGAVEELERWAANPRFACVVLPFRTHMPIGNRKYWDILEAIVHHDLPIAFHPGNGGNNPYSGAGFPSFYYEDHCGLANALLAQLSSLVCEGVFDRWPSLRVVALEGGWTWIPAYSARFDSAWSQFGDELPHLQRRPSEYLREHLWFSTQPLEESENPKHFAQALGLLDAPDRIMFSSDYPHWDFDSPTEVSRLVPDHLREGIMGHNAIRCFPRLAHLENGGHVHS